ncbi:DoxX family protein [Neolewinella sp.]|uniref:DoxX family protein n=1 Tax=Neolewinella sp. TaxID=2993543 RepID=UPI003B524CA9
MPLLPTLDRLHHQVRRNLWLRYFTYGVRVLLAVGFIPAGIVKLTGERFASGLSVVHPMGSYLVALQATGFYYTFIGVVQVLAGVLLLIPRTALLGAVLYFPIIFNICVLSLAVRFEGSLLTAPLMVLANVYLLCWHWDRIRFLLPLREEQLRYTFVPPGTYDRRFPLKFVALAGTAAVATVAATIALNVYAIMPRNSLGDCNTQFTGTERSARGADFCACIHERGGSLATCLEEYEGR